MKNYFQYCIILYLLICQTTTLFGAGLNSSLYNCEFESIKLNDGSSEPVVYCFYQNQQGEMWIGSSVGLSRYDGYRIKTYKHVQSDSTSISNSRTYCFLRTSKGELYIGTFKGLNRYDEKTDKFILLKYTSNYLITSLLEDKNGEIWMGTNSGLLKFDPIKNQWTQFSRESKSNPFPSDYVACNFIDSNGTIYAGTHEYLCRKLRQKNQFENIYLPFPARFKNNLLLSICEDEENVNLLWLGTEQGLFTMNPNTGESTISLTGMVIKCLFYDKEKNLWIGTDNGLYIKPKGSQNFIVKKRNVDNTSSIQNNVIWSISMDRNYNLWLGTDNGVSTTQTSKKFQFTSFKDLTGSTEGNQLKTILRDSHNFLWLGGSNGLIRYDLNTHKSRWFKSDNSQKYSLTHDKVRYLYQDKSSLWIATDGGLNRYDYKSQTLSHYLIKDIQGLYNSKWMYYIYEDLKGQLWLATYDGGIFVVSKSELLASNGGTIMAKKHYGTNQGNYSISSNIVNSITPGKNGSIWIGTDDAGVNCIQPQNGKIISLNPSKGGLNTNFVKSIISDPVGNIWVFTDNGINRISPSTNSAHPIFEKELVSKISFYALQKDRLWINSQEGIKCVDWKTKKIKNIFLDKRSYSCAYYFPQEQKMYMGASDGFIEFNPDSIYSQQTIPSLSITNLVISNELVKVGTSYDKNTILRKSLPYQSKITLNYNQNSFSLEFSSFLFEKSAGIRYAYRLKGFEDRWQKNDGLDNKASFINVPPGNYTFEVQTIDSNGKMMENTASLDIKIRVPWYSSIFALFIYSLIILYILYQFWRIFRYRQLLRFERMERTKTLELTKMKTDFFANVSHEFKTPLSLIIGHVSQLVVNESENSQKRELISIQKNAQKIHLLINQMLDYNEDKSKSDLILSETSLVDFAKDSFDQFEKEFAAKNIKAEFIAEDILYPFLIDQVKMESVFSNLLSNALKFVSPQGFIRFTISKAKESDNNVTVKITVEDNGCGISEPDLPKVFDRYFKSSDSQYLNKDGSGIGLSLVKTIIEDHGGSVSIQSQKGEGTTVSISLSTKKTMSFIKSNNDIEHTLLDISKFINLPQKPTILIVEDNDDIRTFIVETLSQKFSFITATNGKEGLEMASKHLPDLIITDITMPIMNGLELCRNLKNNIHTTFIPVIVLTAKNDRQTEMNALVEQADVFISKPFDINYLSDRIIQLILKRKRTEEKTREKEFTNPQEEILPSSDEKFLKQITALIEEYLSDTDLNVTTLGQKSGMGDKQIYRKIKQLTGMTVVEYIRSIRLKKAAMFLRQNKLSVSEILYLVGFSTHSYFTKCFKEEYGMSPKEFVSNNINISESEEIN